MKRLEKIEAQKSIKKIEAKLLREIFYEDGKIIMIVNDKIQEGRDLIKKLKTNGYKEI